MCGCVFYKNDFVVVVTMRKEVKVVIEKIEIWRERERKDRIRCERALVL